MIGPNGAGKTSIFNMISRFYQPSGGRIFFEDVEITQLPPYKIAQLGVARTFQNIELFDNATVLANLLVGRHRHRRDANVARTSCSCPRCARPNTPTASRVEEVIDFLDLQRYRDQLIASLPYGVRKVCELARALCTEPKILLLDEPSSGLNVEETDDMVYLDQRHPFGARHHGADGRARHDAGQSRVRPRARPRLRPGASRSERRRRWRTIPT